MVWFPLPMLFYKKIRPGSRGQLDLVYLLANWLALEI